jgi:MFS family permease
VHGTRPLDALRQRAFRRFWIGALVSNTGSWMQNAAIPFVAFELTGSSGDIGVTGFFQYVPFMLMGLLGGGLADRFPRRALLIASQCAQALCAAALWLLVASGAATTTWLAVLAFASGLAAGLNTPIWQSFVTELVERDLLLHAVTLNSAQFNAARAVGPLLTGVVIAAWGVSVTFLINAVSFLFVIGVLLTITGRSDGTRRTVDGGVWRGARDAGRYVLASPPIVACCVAIVAVAGLGSPLFSYLVVYGEEVFAVDGLALGVLFGAAGIGAVLFTPAMLALAPRLPRARLLGAAMLCYGVSVAATGLAPVYAAAVAALLFFGAAYLAIASTINTTIQLVVREDVRGTVIAIYLACLTGALPIGLLVWGVVSDAVGIRPTTVGAGALLVVVTGVFIATGRFAVMADADAARDAAAARGTPDPLA